MKEKKLNLTEMINMLSIKNDLLEKENKRLNDRILILQDTLNCAEELLELKNKLEL